MGYTAAFDNTYARLPEQFYTRLDPSPVRAPRLVAYNHDLAQILGLPDAPEEALARVYGGVEVPEGAAPLAQLYAGHQFGHYSPQLGDGRAILLGEVVGRDGLRRDIQLKGSGKTPYSRMGDGRAWLGPVLREYIVSEAMHALGIPTTRALAAVLTGENVLRETVLPGAVLTRVAQSHLRVGTFQVFAHRGQIDDLRRLTDYAIARHYPDADGAMGLLRTVCAAQAKLVAQWMSVGFIHGVMNTDNCTISGETIDYGPCAFMDDFHANRVYSSIDQQGRYAYSNQPRIVIWNMAQFATALIQQCADREAAVEKATALVHAMPAQIERHWLDAFAAKIGIAAPEEGDGGLIEDLLALMQEDGADFTNTFDALTRGDARDQFTDRDAFDAWQTRWQDRVGDLSDAAELMARSNPRIVPRNHRLEEMIAAAVSGDYAPFERLRAELARPYDTEDRDLMRPPQPDEVVPATFCGT
ncbi:YdiU family protein [Sulfitobacter sp. D35]|uniref:protein adenylyltransferase SelO n=1 Tax=Sulfitobacter sp. D35 TaxID=3083252 RepID=UPI00296EDFA7|nr:YdiU family protein [Sulfitobacter sp. D35]MDW4497608.1 YdiU family protein [Sulfitobacter sp. D35]